MKTSQLKKDLFYSSYLTLLLGLWSTALLAQTTLKLDHPTATYTVGETAQFELTTDQSGTAAYKFYTRTNGPILSSGTINVVAGNSISIPITLNEPGIVFCEVDINNVIPISAAIFSPYDIAPLESEPSDFDNFWQAAKNEIAAIPIDAQVTFERNNAYSTTYRVNLANINNRRVYGYLTVPNGSGPFPAVVKFPAFGDSPNLAGIGEDVAERTGALYFSMNIHNVEPDQSDPNAYEPNNLNDPNGVFYKTVVTAGIRVIDYLHTRSDFDGQNIGLLGESQGGGITLMVAGVDDRVDAIISSNPTHCQNLGFKYGKASGFGFFLNDSAPISHQQSVKYYDNMYFARRFKGTAWMMISYEDDVCPAATTFAAFNQLTGPKILTHSIDLKHVHPGQFWNERYAFFRRYLPTANPSDPNVGNELSYAVEAGVDQNISSGGQANLAATVINNSNTNPNIPVQWSKINGPGTINFGDAQNYSSTANFTEEGNYALQFAAEDTELINSNPPQYFTYFDAVNVTAGNCTDDDGDGICANQDCDDGNENIPALPGTDCDDGNPDTENDVILANGCSCQGTPIVNCMDNDGDGLCADQDCDDGNPNLPALPGTDCDDGNPNTPNDVIQADGCTCEGTSTNDPTVCDVEISLGNGTITVSGMDEPIFRLEVFNQFWSETFFECYWDNCPTNTTISNLETGTYVVKVQSFTASWSAVCDFVEYVNVVNTGGPCTDNDGDGVCADQDCNDENENIPTTPGTDCDDGNPETENDVILANGCSCEGTPITSCTDNDGDGVCADQDCNDENENIPTTPGTDCDDGNPETENDVILVNGCSCEGTPINTGEPNCDNVQFDGSNNQLTISGLTAPIEIIRVRNSQWQEVFSCIGNCENPIALSNLSAGLYRIQIQMYTENWSPICYKETETTVSDATASNRNQEVAYLPTMQIFPNPAEERVNIYISDYGENPVQLTILNQLGKVMLQQDNALATNNGRATIDLQDFTNGLYFVQLRTNGRQLMTQKLLVARLY